MRTSLLLCLALAATSCATTRPAGGPPPPTAFQPVCQPCPMPCTPDSCAPKAVAAAPKPAPAPAPTPPPPSPAAEPSFSPAPGSFTGKQLVTLSTTTPGAVIHYTTDGSAPTEASPVYTGPITVDKDTTINAIAVAPGAPASTVARGNYGIQAPSRVTVTKERLELKDKIYFDTGKATIKPVSYSLLDEVAAALKSHDEVKKVRIEGHTDSVGKPAMNQKLSQARAEAVRKYLVDKGIAPARLEAKGFGQKNPVESNKTAKGREANRRVELKIVE